MRATREQVIATTSIMQKNPSMVWDGKFGFYSSGQCVISFYWNFDDPKEMFKIKINPNGEVDH